MIKRSIKNISKKIGLSPGSVVFVGEKEVDETKITIIDYDYNTFKEVEVNKIEECFKYKDTETITWINVAGLHNVEIISKLCKYYDIHPLVQEDIVNTTQRPKIEFYDGYIFIVVKFLQLENDELKIIPNQFSIILSENFVLTFQEKPIDILKIIKERISRSNSNFRKMHSDYLAYALLDIIIDHYFVILESISNKLETLDEMLLTNPTQRLLNDIYIIKREILFLRRVVWPLREIINSLKNQGHKLIHEEIFKYLNDLYDHIVRVIDIIETSREMIASMNELYHSISTNKTNEVIKTLTVIATIFIPLTFIASIYGMNFDFMPELRWRYGYFVVLSSMIIIGIIMLSYFKRKKWL
ncbi:MAG: magnesium transport protein CorA [Candidatus Nitrosocaldaceae archaeon]|nr:MAG: magnesium transport protein CorA [Candidatus Nitrosocaldaceae archaeon]